MDTLLDNWTELSSRVRRIVAPRVADAATADDITQDVMLKVQTHLDELPPEEKLPAWLNRLARNAIIDHYRAQAVRSHFNIEDHEVASDSETARSEMLRELLPCLGRMVERLPEPYRTAMKEADLEGLSQQEVADRAGITLSAAKSRVQRARQQLRAMILDCCHVETDRRGGLVDYEPTERAVLYCGSVGDDANCGR